MAGNRDSGDHATPPYDWWKWAEETDWSDWRSWLQRVASTDWAAGPWPGAPWLQAPRAGGTEMKKELEEVSV